MVKTIHNIVLLIDSRGFGGIETHVANLAKGLISYGHNVQIVMIKNYGVHPVFELDDRLKPLLVKLDGGVLSLYRLIRKSHISVVHTHGYKSGVIGRMICWLCNKAVVSTFHSGEQGGIKTRLYRWLDRISAKTVPCLCVSKQISQTLSQDSNVIQNFVEVPHPSPTVDLSASQIAFVGRFSYEKGPDLFIDIAAQLPQYHFCMYGNGPMFTEIEATKPNNVRLAGHVDSMNPFWRNIKFLCITSREEGLPLVALEALSRGVIVLSFDIGGIATVVKNGSSGWLFPPLRKDLFTKGIVCGQNTDKHKYKAMTLFSYQFIKEYFSSEAVIPKIVDIYCKAIARRAYEK